MGLAILEEGEADESKSRNDTKRRCGCGCSLKKAKRHPPELPRTSRHIVGRVGTGGTSGTAAGSLGAHASAHACLGQAAVHEIGRPRLLPPGRSSHGFGQRLRPNRLKQAKHARSTAGVGPSFNVQVTRLGRHRAFFRVSPRCPSVDFPSSRATPTLTKLSCDSKRVWPGSEGVAPTVRNHFKREAAEP
jgi:hypothetical protein